MDVSQSTSGNLMETDFNLMETLQQWRTQLGALSEDDRMEIEGHLQDSMRELCGTGLTEREAFLVARERLGEVTNWAAGRPSPRLMGRWWWTALGLLGLTSAVVCLIVSLFIPKMHEGRCVVELLVEKQDLPTQRAILESTENLVEVLRAQGRGLNALNEARELQTRLHFDPIPDTAMVVILVEDESSDRAAELANAIPAAYESRRLAMDEKARELKRLALEGVFDEAEAKHAKLNSAGSQLDAKSPSLGIPIGELAKVERIRQLEANVTAAQEDWQKAAAQRALDQALTPSTTEAPKLEEIDLARQVLAEARTNYVKFQAEPPALGMILRRHEMASSNPMVLTSSEVEHLRWWALALGVLGIAGLAVGHRSAMPFHESSMMANGSG